ncbi:hypothetical protein K1719_045135 [Acacia pycnantha]|nr:hypothetical protein K1719_045135 [Acacia pycnantha]
MTVTKDAIADFDWSSFILQELCEEIHEFKKDSQKSKRKQSKTVGGCLYFLMLFCFQNFSLGNIITSQYESAMAFWTDEKVVRTAYARLLSNLQQEMLVLQHRLSEEGQHEGSAPNKQPSTSRESGDDNGHDIEEGDDIDKGDETENIIDVDDVPEHGEETPNVDAGLAGEQCEDAAVPEHQSKPVQEEVKEPGLELRRSQRVITPSSILKSPWIDPKRKSKGKRTYDEKDTLYELCTKTVSEYGAAEEFVDMQYYFLKRKELQCLNPRAWIVIGALTYIYVFMVFERFWQDLADDYCSKDISCRPIRAWGGVVHRHIFTADFMDKMISPDLKWTVESNVAQILLEHVGYNIGDCHFIFGPSFSKSLVLLCPQYDNYGFLHA